MPDLLDVVPWPVRTERLRIRRVTSNDAEALWRHRRLPEVTQWISNNPKDLDTFRAELVRPERLAVLLVIELVTAEGATVLGDMMVRVEDGSAQRETVEAARSSQAELGWTLNPVYGGRGYATEAVRAIVGVCFGALGLRRVHARCFAENEPSWRLMERIGMRREEHSRKAKLHRSGVWMDVLRFGLLAEEWPA
ncbi:GNAT family N-acetyltransferase [Promicromonospora sp. NPDC052451]|uniref:GNAT family N-acetyltransferase n=1 Tax=Promicromonospora sp. NPDC052451 TaxID=3364407 RepID=UPI0037CB5F55